MINEVNQLWCEQLRQLCSESLDRALNSNETASLEYHLKYCKDCFRYQVKFHRLRAIIGVYKSENNNDNVKLPKASLRRMQQEIAHYMLIERQNNE